MSEEYQAWTCKIIVKAKREDLPNGFDSPPRMAAENAIESAGIPVVLNSSGWGGEVTEDDLKWIKERSQAPYPDIYFAGLMDAPEDTEH